MLFKFPQKKIVLDCFTSDHYVIEQSPIDFAIKHIPDWWKNLPTSITNQNNFAPAPTMKHCVGMVDYYKNSIALPLWSDLAIRVNQNKSYNWKFSNSNTQAVVHPINEQATGFLNNYGHLKISSPWYLKSEKNIDWVWSHPTYNYAHSNDIVSLPGIVNYYHQHATNINIMISLEKEKTILIPHSQPLVIMTPMSDRKIKIVHHLVSQQELNKMKNPNITFLQRYKNSIKARERFSSCPFHKK